VEAAGGGSFTKAETHKVKLSLKPKWGKKAKEKAEKDKEEGDEVLVGRRRRGGGA
jgi:hypothetical protein